MGFTLYYKETEKLVPIFFISNNEKEFIDYINEYVNKKLDFEYYYLHNKKRKKEEINFEIDNKVKIVTNKDIINRIMYRQMFNITRDIKENAFYFNNICYIPNIDKGKRPKWTDSKGISLTYDMISHISDYQYFMKKDTDLLFEILKTFPELYKERINRYK